MEPGVDALVVACVQASGLQGLCPEGYAQVLQPSFLVAAGHGGLLFSAMQPFDAVQAAAIFAQTFGLTILLWYLSFSIGQVIKVFRRL